MLNLIQEALARQAVYSMGTIRKIEADERRLDACGSGIGPNSALQHGAVAAAHQYPVVKDSKAIHALDPDLEPPTAARRLADAVCEAAGLLWSSPLYHGTISGSFKNALDWLHILADRDPPCLTHKVIGLISTAGGVQGLQAVNTMEFAVRALRAWAVPMVQPIPRAWGSFAEDGSIRNPVIAEQLRALGREVVRAARQLATTGKCDYA